MPLPKTWLLGFTVGLLAAFMLVSAAFASPAAACSGGIAFDWAVANARAGILEARVVSAQIRADYTYDLEIAAPKVVRGDPSTGSRFHATEGYPCDQSADAGELVVLLFGVRGGPDEPPIPDAYLRVPLVYVIEGRDALAPSVVAAAFAQLPPTDTANIAPEPSQAPRMPVLEVLIAAAGGMVVMFRRNKPRPTGDR